MLIQLMGVSECSPETELAALALAACTESAEEHFESFLAKAEIHCARSYYCGTVPPEQVLSCMNDALASGARGEASWQWQDLDGFYVQTYVFTVDHQIKVFELHPDGDNFTPESYARELATCAGPFRLPERVCAYSFDYITLAWDGCP